MDTGAIDADHATVYGGEGGLPVRPVRRSRARTSATRSTAATTAARPSIRVRRLVRAGLLGADRRAPAYNPVEARFDAPRPNYNFNPAAGTWGAFELAARYSVLDLNFREGDPGAATRSWARVRGGEQKIITVGVNWYLNPSMRLMLDYQHVEIDRLGATGVQIGQSTTPWPPAARSTSEFAWRQKRGVQQRVPSAFSADPI